MRHQKHNLTEGPVGGHIKRLALAMGWGIVAMNIVQFTDMYFISRLGHDALAAISFTFPVTGFLFFLILAMSSGMTSAIARAAGGEWGCRCVHARFGAVSDVSRRCASSRPVRRIGSVHPARGGS